MKYIPYGEEDIMFPYLTRRAQESKLMLDKNNVPYELLKQELKDRIMMK